jgi:hypothetical protein
MTEHPVDGGFELRSGGAANPGALVESQEWATQDDRGRDDRH